MSRKEEIPRFKIIIVGEASVGKTSILRKFTDNIFEHDIMNTIGIDFSQKDVVVENKKIRLQIWDTAGQERFHSITKSYYRGSHAIVLVFSLSDEKTFDCIDRWLKNIEEEIEDARIPVILVGNKNDERERHKIEFKYLESKVNQLNDIRKKDGNEEYMFFKTSAKNGENVEDLFMYISEKLLKLKAEDSEKRYKINKHIKKNKPGCC